MSSNENTGSIPKNPQSSPVLADDSPGDDPKEQPTTHAGGGLGPLEDIIEKSEEKKK